MTVYRYVLAGLAAAILFAAPAAAQDDKVDQLAKRVDALEAQVQQARGAPPPLAASPASGWWNNTSISGRVYFDISSVEHKSDGVKLAGSGVGFDLKRFYIGVDHVFNAMFAVNITTDATYDSATGTSQIFVKKAYAQVTLDPALVLRFGSADMPWIPYADGINGYRFIDNSLIDRTKFGTSADWGVHALGSVLNGLLSYDLAAVNGGGFRKFPSGGGANRFERFDLEGRVSLAYDGFNLALGGYSGKLGRPYGTVTYHTADRYNVLAAYTANGVRVGMEYFSAGNWTSVTKIAADSAHGWSGFASWAFHPPFAVFARYDDVTPNSKTAPLLKEHYYDAGLSWTPVRNVDLALTWKHDDAAHGTLSTTTAGTIGGAVNGSYNEFGLFGGWQF
jgi:hypothetical protein